MNFTLPPRPSPPSKPSPSLRWPALLLASALFVAPVAGWSKDKTLDDAAKLKRQSVELYQHRDYAGAEALARRVLEIREKALGPNHPDVAAGVNDLGVLERMQGRYAESEALFTRALAIREKALGPNHPDVAVSLNSLGALYADEGRYDDAATAAKRALAIREKALGPDNLAVAESLGNLGADYNELGRYAMAEPLYQRAAAIYEKKLGPDDPNVAMSLNRLADLYDDESRFSEAEPLYKRALAIRVKVSGPGSVDVATTLGDLATSYERQGRYAEAEPLHQRALAIKEKSLGPGDPDLAWNSNNFAALNERTGRYADAERLHKRALAIRENGLGPDHPDVAWSLFGLAGVYDDEGRYDEAEPLLKRALAIREKALGPDHPLVAASLNSLAILYNNEGRYDDAERLYERALAVAEKSLGAEHANVAQSLNNLAAFYDDRGRYAEAERAYKRALAIREKLAPESVSVAETLNNLANLYSQQDRYSDADALYARSLAIWEKALGPDHPAVASSLFNHASSFGNRGDNAAAEPLHKRALAIREKALGPDHPSVAASYDDLALTLHGEGKLSEALAASRRSIDIRVARFGRGAGDRQASENKAARNSFIILLSLIAEQTSGKSSDPKTVEEAFRAAQYAGGVDTARALAGMTARFAAGSDALAALVRTRQDLQSRGSTLDGLLTTAVSQPPEKRNNDTEASLRKELAAVDARLGEIDDRLRKDFPRFAELASAQPATLAGVQDVLAPDEAIALWAPWQAESYGFVVRKQGAVFFRVPLGEKQLSDAVAHLRDGLDPHGRQLIDMPPYDAAAAYVLEDKLLGSAASLLAGTKSLIVVPAGALQSLPFSALVTEAPKAPIANFADYRSVAWLARRYAVAVLPAASSLTALRHFGSFHRAGAPFAGFGAPQFKSDVPAEAKAKPEPVELVSLFRGASANVEGLRQLPPLPETAQELKTEARALGAPDSSVYLGKDATVTKVESLDLSDTRVIAFATHGLIAGELPKLAEPALAFTPPAVASDKDDGLLRASQVAQLKLNADWVLLSACNTAAPDGTPGAEGLSGLAKGFLYAGARSIMVSHWSVDSLAAAKLTTGAFKALESQPDIGRAEALRRSILAMIDGAGEAGSPEYYTHPLYWAPFVIVGEGGAGR